MMGPMRRAVLACGLLVIGLNGCLVATGATATATLAPTLTMVEAAGLEVAMQNGIPVPSFDWQPRPRIELAGPWRFEPVALDEIATLTDRRTSLAVIEEGAGERQLPAFDDSAWAQIEVPGSMNPPPDGEEGGAWYRRTFDVPRIWAGQSVTLRFGSASYVADVWLNGTWLGYHEGGSTPFAFDVGTTLQPGAPNVVAVRVHAIPRGTRTDVVPWGATDFWNYAGLTGPVWLEAAPPVHVPRADVVPHLDALEVSVLVSHSATLVGGEEPEPVSDDASTTGKVRAAIFAATVDRENLLDTDPRSLVIALDDPLLAVDRDLDLPAAGGLAGETLALQFGDADTWSPAVPALYVLRVQLVDPGASRGRADDRIRDEFWTTFGIRHVGTDSRGPSVQLNGEPIFLRGVGLHDESLTFDAEGGLVSGSPAPTLEEILDDLRDAAALGADFIRAGHEPADPQMLMLADRLGFAVWEEIPLYHATPIVFERSMGRGIPQQMLREMALRDMNRPSVLFHGFANESTGDEERTDALSELHAVDRAIDGTRLTGQAAYGWRPDDPTQAPLDVAGFTFYHGVFYGSDPALDTQQALRDALAAHPDKPLMILEFGRWADEAADEALQRDIFEQTYAALVARRGDQRGGAVAGVTWWALHDFATPLAGIRLEQFGLYRPDGSLRPAGEVVASSFAAPAGRGDDLALDPSFERPRFKADRLLDDWSLAAYVGYALVLPIGALTALLLVLTRRGGRATGRRRTA
jgi:beta-galactosidase